MKPGHTNNPQGRPKGVPNKTTARVKEAFATLLEGKIGKLAEWLDRLAITDPKAALEVYIKVSERFIPKVRSTEVTLRGDEEIMKAFKFKFDGVDVDDDKEDDDEDSKS